MVEGPRFGGMGVGGDGDVASTLHQEGSYTMLNRRVDVAVARNPVRKQKIKNDKPRVIRRLWGERAFYKARSRVARNAGRGRQIEEGQKLGL